MGAERRTPVSVLAALIALIVPVRGSVLASLGPFVASVLVSAAVVASVFHLWRDRVYERRADFLYQSTKGDDHVLVPVRGEHPETSAMLAARLAGAHDAGKVVLLDVVNDEQVAAAERDQLLDDREQFSDEEDAQPGTYPDAEMSDPANPEWSRDNPDVDDGPSQDPEPSDAALAAGREAAVAVEEQANRIETKVGVPCQVLVAAGEDRASVVIDAALRSNCDLIVAPYEHQHGALTGFIRGLFDGPVDVLVHRATEERIHWRRILVPVRSASDVAHAMVDFGKRLAGSTVRIALCHCIGARGHRRRAESMLADLAEIVHGDIETRVSRQIINEFLANTAANYDMVFLGASRDRSAASRLISPPTFERIQDIDCDVAILDRNFRY